MPVALPLAAIVTGSSNSKASRTIAAGALPHENLTRLRRLLEPRRDVHCVAGYERAADPRQPDNDVASVDADAKLKRVTEEVGEPLLHGDGRMQRALGVILL